MNYEILSKKLPNEITSDKLISKTFLLLISSIVFVPAAYVVVAAVFIAQTAKGGLNYRKLDAEFKLVCTYIILGVVFSRFKLISSVYAAMFMLCMYSYYLFFSSLNSWDIVKAKKILYAVSIIVFLIGIFQYFSPEFSMPSKWVDADEFKLSKRIYSTFYNPNIFGFYINFIIILACEKLDFKKINAELIAFISGICCLFLTFSRTSWISLIASLLIASIFNKKYLKYTAIVSAAIFGADALLGIGRINPASAAEDSSFLYRIEIWKACIAIIKDNFFTGIGFGTLSRHISGYSNVVKTNIEHCHNIFLQIFTETGIIGFGIFSYLFIRITRTLLIYIKTRSDKHQWITAFTVLAMSLIHGSVDSVLLTPQILLIMSIYAGSLRAIKK